jgi:hypothetical protein
MTKHKIEGNLNFYDELYKSLDDSDDDEINMCQITGLPLIEKSVTLECNHHFNYDSLYKEICRQKYEFKTYDTHTLSNKDQQKVRSSGFNYFIKCPYCRNIQFTILPYYEELGLEKKYGINSLDTTLPSASTTKTHTYYNDHANYTFTKYGVMFKKGACGHKYPTGNLCSEYFVALIPDTNFSYCKHHYRSELKHHKLLEKKKILDEKNKEKQELKNKKEELLNERKKLFEEKNIERVAKGLPPLKHLPVLKKKVENVIEQQNQPIPQYVPEENEGCHAILKSGPNKGKQCGCKKLEANGLCKRHNQKDPEIKVEKAEKNDL